RRSRSLYTVILLLATGDRASIRVNCSSDCAEAGAAAGSAALLMMLSTSWMVAGSASLSIRRSRIPCNPSRTFTPVSIGTLLAMTPSAIVPQDEALSRKRQGDGGTSASQFTAPDH